MLTNETMDYNVLLEDIRIAAGNLVKNSINRKPPSTVYCNKVCKAVDKVSSWNSDYENVITGLWVITAHFTDYLDHLAPVPSLREAASRLFRECAKTVLNIQWQNLEENSDVRQRFLISLANLNAKLVPLNFQRFRLLESLLENPWTDPTLAKIMGGEAEDEEEKEEVRTYIEGEDAVILQLRVDMMLKENCEEYALNLCNSCLLHPELKRDLKLRKTQLSLLYKLGHRDKMQEECQNLSIEEAVVIIKQLQTKATKEVCTVLAQTFMVQYWIKQSDHKANKELLKLWIRQQALADKDQDRFKESVWSIAKLSQSTEQILFFIDIVREQCGGTYLQLYVDICIFAVNVDKGQMETSLKQGEADVVKARKEDMAAICAKLSCLVHHASIKAARICILTAFALKPSTETFTAISKFYGKDHNCCSTCVNKTESDFGTINPATLYEVERLLNMLRPEYLNPDNSVSSIQQLCERFLKENSLNFPLESPPTPQDTQLRVVQIEAFGKPKATSVKASNVFEAVPAPNMSNAQALLRNRLQNVCPIQPSTSQNFQMSHAQHIHPNILQSGQRYTSPTAHGQMNMGVSISETNKCKQPSIKSNMPQPKIYASLSKSDSQAQNTYNQSSLSGSSHDQSRPVSQQGKNPTKLNPQLIQYIQSAVRQDSSVLQELTKHPDKDVVRTVLNMMSQGVEKKGNTMNKSVPPQQSPASSLLGDQKRLPTVSTLLKSQTSQQQLSQGHVVSRPIIPRSSASSLLTYHQQPESYFPQSQSNQSPVSTSLSDMQKAESFRLAKAQAGNIRSAMQSQLSTLSHQKQQVLSKQMSGSTITVNQPSSSNFQFNVSSNLHNKTLSKYGGPHKDIRASNESLNMPNKPIQYNSPSVSKSQAQQFISVNNQNSAQSYLISMQQPSAAQSSAQKQSALPSDELSGSIMGIDDTIIKELLQDSGILANTFPDIEVDFNLDDTEKRRDGRVQTNLQHTAQSRNVKNRTGLSSMAQLAGVPLSFATSNTNQNSPLAVNMKSSNSLSLVTQRYNKPGSSPLGALSSINMMTPTAKTHHYDSNIFNQRHFPEELTSSKHNDTQQQMSVEQIREVMKQEQIEGEVTMDSSNNATYRCIICSLAFKVLEELREHVRNVCKPGLQSSSVYNTKIKQDRANSAKAGLETTTVFQCLRCFELCISDVGIKQHRLTCKRVPTVPPDIKNNANFKSRTPPSSRSTTPKLSTSPSSAKSTLADNSSKIPEMPLPFPYPSLNSQEVINNLQVAAAGNDTRPNDISIKTSIDKNISETSSDVECKIEIDPLKPQEVAAKKEVEDCFHEKPEKKPPEKIPPVNYSEISGSGGSKFYRCKNCFQTLCSFESLLLHWKECATKPPVFPNRNQQFPLDPDDELEPGEIRPLIGQVLDNVVNVISAVAGGDIGDTPDLDLDMDSSDTETLFSLDDPCEVELPKKPSGKISKKEFPSLPFLNSNNILSSDVAKSTTTSANRKISCLQMKDDVFEKGKRKESSGKDLVSVAPENSASKSSYLKPKSKEEETETSDKEDDTQSSDSELNSVQVNREAPPKLRDRSKLKPIQSFINESFTSPFAKTGVHNNSTVSKKGKVKEKQEDTSHSNEEKEGFKLSVVSDTVKEKQEKAPQSGDESEKQSYKCIACGKKCQSKRILIQHYAGKHLQPYTMNTLSECSSYYCHLCKKTFSNFMHYMHHVPNHANIIMKNMSQYSNPVQQKQHWSNRIAASTGFSRANSPKKGKISPNQAKALLSKRKAAKTARERLKRFLSKMPITKPSPLPLDREIDSKHVEKKKTQQYIATPKSAQLRLHEKLLKRKPKSFSLSENEDSCQSASPYVSDDDYYAVNEDSEDSDSDSTINEPRQTRNRSKSMLNEGVIKGSQSLACVPEYIMSSELLPTVNVHRLTQSELDRFTKSKDNEVKVEVESSPEPKPSNETKHSNFMSSFQSYFESYIKGSVDVDKKPHSESDQSLSEQKCGKTCGEDGSSKSSCVNASESVSKPQGVLAGMEECKDDDDSPDDISEIISSVNKRRCSVNLGLKVDLASPVITDSKSKDEKESISDDRCKSPAASRKNNIHGKEISVDGIQVPLLPICAVRLERNELVEKKATIPDVIILNSHDKLSDGSISEHSKTDLKAKKTEETDNDNKKDTEIVASSSGPVTMSANDKSQASKGKTNKKFVKRCHVENVETSASDEVENSPKFVQKMSDGLEMEHIPVEESIPKHEINDEKSDISFSLKGNEDGFQKSSPEMSGVNYIPHHKLTDSHEQMEKKESLDLLSSPHLSFHCSRNDEQYGHCLEMSPTETPRSNKFLEEKTVNEDCPMRSQVEEVENAGLEEKPQRHDNVLPSTPMTHHLELCHDVNEERNENEELRDENVEVGKVGEGWQHKNDQEKSELDNENHKDCQKGQMIDSSVSSYSGDVQGESVQDKNDCHMKGFKIDGDEMKGNELKSCYPNGSDSGGHINDDGSLGENDEKKYQGAFSLNNNLDQDKMDHQISDSIELNKPSESIPVERSDLEPEDNDSRVDNKDGGQSTVQINCVLEQTDIDMTSNAYRDIHTKNSFSLPGENPRADEEKAHNSLKEAREELNVDRKNDPLRECDKQQDNQVKTNFDTEDVQDVRNRFNQITNSEEIKLKSKAIVNGDKIQPEVEKHSVCIEEGSEQTEVQNQENEDCQEIEKEEMSKDQLFDQISTEMETKHSVEDDMDTSEPITLQEDKNLKNNDCKLKDNLDKLENLKKDEEIAVATEISDSGYCSNKDLILKSSDTVNEISTNVREDHHADSVEFNKVDNDIFKPMKDQIICRTQDHLSLDNSTERSAECNLTEQSGCRADGENNQGIKSTRFDLSDKDECTEINTSKISDDNTSILCQDSSNKDPVLDVKDLSEHSSSLKELEDSSPEDESRANSFEQVEEEDSKVQRSPSIANSDLCPSQDNAATLDFTVVCPTGSHQWKKNDEQIPGYDLTEFTLNETSENLDMDVNPEKNNDTEYKKSNLELITPKEELTDKDSHSPSKETSTIDITNKMENYTSTNTCAINDHEDINAKIYPTSKDITGIYSQADERENEHGPKITKSEMDFKEKGENSAAVFETGEENEIVCVTDNTMSYTDNANTMSCFVDTQLYGDSSVDSFLTSSVDASYNKDGTSLERIGRVDANTKWDVISKEFHITDFGNENMEVVSNDHNPTACNKEDKSEYLSGNNAGHSESNEISKDLHGDHGNFEEPNEVMAFQGSELCDGQNQRQEIFKMAVVSDESARNLEMNKAEEAVEIEAPKPDTSMNYELVTENLTMDNAPIEACNDMGENQKSQITNLEMVLEPQSNIVSELSQDLLPLKCVAKSIEGNESMTAHYMELDKDIVENKTNEPCSEDFNSKEAIYFNEVVTKKKATTILKDMEENKVDETISEVVQVREKDTVSEEDIRVDREDETVSENEESKIVSEDVVRKEGETVSEAVEVTEKDETFAEEKEVGNDDKTVSEDVEMSKKHKVSDDAEESKEEKTASNDVISKESDSFSDDVEVSKKVKDEAVSEAVTSKEDGIEIGSKQLELDKEGITFSNDMSFEDDFEVGKDETVSKDVDMSKEDETVSDDMDMRNEEETFRNESGVNEEKGMQLNQEVETCLVNYAMTKQNEPCVEDVEIKVDQPCVEDVEIKVDQPCEDVEIKVDQPCEEDVEIKVDHPCEEDVEIKVDQPCEDVEIKVDQPCEEDVEIKVDQPCEEDVEIKVDHPCEPVEIKVDQPCEEDVEIKVDQPCEEDVEIKVDQPCLGEVEATMVDSADVEVKEIHETVSDGLAVDDHSMSEKYVESVKGSKENGNLEVEEEVDVREERDRDPEDPLVSNDKIVREEEVANEEVTTQAEERVKDDKLMNEEQTGSEKYDDDETVEENIINDRLFGDVDSYALVGKLEGAYKIHDETSVDNPVKDRTHDDGTRHIESLKPGFTESYESDVDILEVTNFYMEKQSYHFDTIEESENKNLQCLAVNTMDQSDNILPLVPETNNKTNIGVSDSLEMDVKDVSETDDFNILDEETFEDVDILEVNRVCESDNELSNVNPRNTRNRSCENLEKGVKAFEEDVNDLSLMKKDDFDNDKIECSKDESPSWTGNNLDRNSEETRVQNSTNDGRDAGLYDSNTEIRDEFHDDMENKSCNDLELIDSQVDDKNVIVEMDIQDEDENMIDREENVEDVKTVLVNSDETMKLEARICDSEKLEVCGESTKDITKEDTVSKKSEENKLSEGSVVETNEENKVDEESAMKISEERQVSEESAVEMSKEDQVDEESPVEINEDNICEESALESSEEMKVSEERAVEMSKDKVDEGSAVEINEDEYICEESAVEMSKDKADEGSAVEINEEDNICEESAMEVIEEDYIYEESAVEMGKEDKVEEGSAMKISEKVKVSEESAVEMSKEDKVDEGSAMKISEEVKVSEESAVEMSKEDKVEEGSAMKISEEVKVSEESAVEISKEDKVDEGSAVEISAERKVSEESGVEINKEDEVCENQLIPRQRKKLDVGSKQSTVRKKSKKVSKVKKHNLNVMKTRGKVYYDEGSAVEISEERQVSEESAVEMSKEDKVGEGSAIEISAERKVSEESAVEISEEVKVSEESSVEMSKEGKVDEGSAVEINEEDNVCEESAMEVIEEDYIYEESAVEMSKENKVDEGSAMKIIEEVKVSEESAVEISKEDKVDEESPVEINEDVCEESAVEINKEKVCENRLIPRQRKKLDVGSKQSAVPKKSKKVGKVKKENLNVMKTRGKVYYDEGSAMKSEERQVYEESAIEMSKEDKVGKGSAVEISEERKVSEESAVEISKEDYVCEESSIDMRKEDEINEESAVEVIEEVKVSEESAVEISEEVKVSEESSVEMSKEGKVDEGSPVEKNEEDNVCEESAVEIFEEDYVCEEISVEMSKEDKVNEGSAVEMNKEDSICEENAMEVIEDYIYEESSVEMSKEDKIDKGSAVEIREEVKVSEESGVEISKEDKVCENQLITRQRIKLDESYKKSTVSKKVSKVKKHNLNVMKTRGKVYYDVGSAMKMSEKRQVSEEGAVEMRKEDTVDEESAVEISEGRQVSEESAVEMSKEGKVDEESPVEINEDHVCEESALEMSEESGVEINKEDKVCENQLIPRQRKKLDVGSKQSAVPKKSKKVSKVKKQNLNVMKTRGKMYYDEESAVEISEERQVSEESAVEMSKEDKVDRGSAMNINEEVKVSEESAVEKSKEDAGSAVEISEERKVSDESAVEISKEDQVDEGSAVEISAERKVSDESAVEISKEDQVDEGSAVEISAERKVSDESGVEINKEDEVCENRLIPRQRKKLEQLAVPKKSKKVSKVKKQNLNVMKTRGKVYYDEESSVEISEERQVSEESAVEMSKEGKVDEGSAMKISEEVKVSEESAVEMSDKDKVDKESSMEINEDVFEESVLEISEEWKVYEESGVEKRKENTGSAVEISEERKVSDENAVEISKEDQVDEGSAVEISADGIVSEESGVEIKKEDKVCENQLIPRQRKKLDVGSKQSAVPKKSKKVGKVKKQNLNVMKTRGKVYYDEGSAMETSEERQVYEESAIEMSKEDKVGEGSAVEISEERKVSEESAVEISKEDYVCEESSIDMRKEDEINEESAVEVIEEVKVSEESSVEMSKEGKVDEGSPVEINEDNVCEESAVEMSEERKVFEESGVEISKEDKVCENQLIPRQRKKLEQSAVPKKSKKVSKVKKQNLNVMKTRGKVYYDEESAVEISEERQVSEESAVEMSKEDKVDEGSAMKISEEVKVSEESAVEMSDKDEVDKESPVEINEDVCEESALEISGEWKVSEESAVEKNKEDKVDLGSAVEISEERNVSDESAVEISKEDKVDLGSAVEISAERKVSEESGVEINKEDEVCENQLIPRQRKKLDVGSKQSAVLKKSKKVSKVNKQNLNVMKTRGKVYYDEECAVEISEERQVSEESAVEMSKEDKVDEGSAMKISEEVKVSEESVAEISEERNVFEESAMETSKEGKVNEGGAVEISAERKVSDESAVEISKEDKVYENHLIRQRKKLDEGSQKSTIPKKSKKVSKVKRQNLKVMKTRGKVYYGYNSHVTIPEPTPKVCGEIVQNPEMNNEVTDQDGDKAEKMKTVGAIGSDLKNEEKVIGGESQEKQCTDKVKGLELEINDTEPGLQVDVENVKNNPDGMSLDKKTENEDLLRNNESGKCSELAVINYNNKVEEELTLKETMSEQICEKAKDKSVKEEELSPMSGKKIYNDDVTEVEEESPIVKDLSENTSKFSDEVCIDEDKALESEIVLKSNPDGRKEDSLTHSGSKKIETKESETITEEVVCSISKNEVLNAVGKKRKASPLNKKSPKRMKVIDVKLEVGKRTKRIRGRGKRLTENVEERKKKQTSKDKVEALDKGDKKQLIIENDDHVACNEEDDDLSDYNLVIEEDKSFYKGHLGPFESRDTMTSETQSFMKGVECKEKDQHHTKQEVSEKKSEEAVNNDVAVATLSSSGNVKSSREKSDTHHGATGKTSWLERKRKAFLEKTESFTFTWDLEENQEQRHQGRETIKTNNAVQESLFKNGKKETRLEGNTCVQTPSEAQAHVTSTPKPLSETQAHVTSTPKPLSEAQAHVTSTPKPPSEAPATVTPKPPPETQAMKVTSKSKSSQKGKTAKESSSQELSPTTKRKYRKRLASPSKQISQPKFQKKSLSSTAHTPMESLPSTPHSAITSSLSASQTNVESKPSSPDRPCPPSLPRKRGRPKKNESSSSANKNITSSSSSSNPFTSTAPQTPSIEKKPEESPEFIAMDDDISFNIRSFSPLFTPEKTSEPVNTNSDEPKKKRGRPRKRPSASETSTPQLQNSKDGMASDSSSPIVKKADVKVKKAGLIPVAKTSSPIPPPVASIAVVTHPSCPSLSKDIDLKNLNDRNEASTSTLFQAMKLSRNSDIMSNSFNVKSTSSPALLKMPTPGTIQKTASTHHGKNYSFLESSVANKKHKTSNVDPSATAAVVKRRKPTLMRWDLPSIIRKKQKHSTSKTTIYRVDPLPKSTTKTFSGEQSDSDRTLHTPLPPGVTQVTPKKVTIKSKWKINREMKPNQVKGKQCQAPISFRRT